MLRLIVQIVDTGDACNVGGPVQTRYRTFDVDLPEVEAELRTDYKWATRSLVGAEIMEQPPGLCPAHNLAHPCEECAIESHKGGA